MTITAALNQAINFRKLSCNTFLKCEGRIYVQFLSQILLLPFYSKHISWTYAGLFTVAQVNGTSDDDDGGGRYEMIRTYSVVRLEGLAAYCCTLRMGPIYHSKLMHVF